MCTYTFSIIITISLNILTNPQIHIFLMERNVITFLFKAFLACVYVQKQSYQQDVLLKNEYVFM